MQLPKVSTKFKTAFTLIELLVVITIISILLAIGTASYSNAQRKGRDGKRKADLKAIQQALDFYYEDNGVYPAASSSGGKIRCNQSGVGIDLNWGTDAFKCDNLSASSLIFYIEKLPKDPTGTIQYIYVPSASSPIKTYTLAAYLENTADQDLSVGCVSTYNYCVKNP